MADLQPTANASSSGAGPSSLRPRALGRSQFTDSAVSTPRLQDGGKANESTPLFDKATNLDLQTLSELSACETVNELQNIFGSEFLVMLSSAQHCVKGFGLAFTQPCRRYLLRQRSVSAPTMQIYTSVATLPWAMKPTYGLLSDFLPIFGYHKMPYMMVASLFGIFAAAFIGMYSENQNISSTEQLVGCFFLVEQMIAVVDLLTEAKYAEKMRQCPILGPALASFVWSGLNIGALAALATSGFVMTKFGTSSPFLIVLIPFGLIFLPLCRNYLGEHPRSPAELEALRAKMMQQKEVCILCFVMFLGTVSLTITGMVWLDPWINGVCAIVVGSVVFSCFFIFLRPITAKANAFFLIQASLCLSIEGASFYFYTDPSETYPQGPNFNKNFYVSYLGVVATLFSLVGIWSYNRYAVNYSYQSLLFVTNVVFGCLSLLDVALFTRANESIGIPDEYFVLGASAFETLIRQWQWLPGVVLNSHLCPIGMEATMYGLLVGSNNLGQAIARNCGALLLHVLGCNPSGTEGDSDKFEHLWVAAMTSSLLPIFAIFLLPILIPDAKQTDQLLADDDRDATVGSLWHRWSGRA